MEAILFSGHGSYGHNSWMVLVLVAVTLAVRLFATRGRRTMGSRTRGGMPSSSSFLGPPTAPTRAGPPPRTGPTYTGIPAGWLSDPSGKHQQRYWSGTAWTEHVTTDGVAGIDPLPERQAPHQGSSPASPALPDEPQSPGAGGTTDLP